MHSRYVIEKLQVGGWYIITQKGSHVQLKHREKPGRVTVASHAKKDIPIGTLKNIEKQAGIILRSQPEKKHGKSNLLRPCPQGPR